MFVEMEKSYLLRQFQERERSYAATELECLAVRDAVKHFEVYLHGRPFVVQTDHHALESLLKSTDLNPKLTRWALYLQQFNIVIKYRPGIQIKMLTDCRGKHGWKRLKMEQNQNRRTTV